jgi:hypothetical protein
MPRLRWHFFELANDAATVVNFNLFIAGLPVQDIFVVAFDPQLTDIVRRRVVHQFAVFIEAFNVFIVDLGNVTNDMRQRGTVRVVATLNLSLPRRENDTGSRQSGPPGLPSGSF